MLVSSTQRWREGRAAYRPAREVVSTRSLDVAEIPDDTTAKRFVEAHHYSGTYPAARLGAFAVWVGGSGSRSWRAA